MILDALFRRTPQASVPPPHDDFWYRPVGMPTEAGIDVTPDVAESVNAVYASVTVLAETIAMLPLKVYARPSPEDKEEAPDHWLWPILHDTPNPMQDAFEFREQMMWTLLMHGNAIALKVFDNGELAGLVPVAPQYLVKIEQMPRRDRTWWLRYTFRDHEGRLFELNDEFVFHLRYRTLDGVMGIAPIESQRETIAHSKVQSNHGARFFANYATPGGVVEAPSMDKVKADEFKQQLQSGFTGHNAWKLLLLTGGATYKQMGLSMEDSQWLEARKLSRSEIAAIFRVPAPLINDLEKATFSNIDRLEIAFNTHTMGPWYARWKQAIQRQLLMGDPKHFAEFVPDALLMGDTKSRYEAYNLAIQAMWMRRSEVRKKENLPPDPEFDAIINPNTTSDGGTQGEPQDSGDGDVDDDAQAMRRELFDAWIDDVAARIASREANAIERRADKAAEDTERFMEFYSEFMRGTQWQYVCRAVSPLVESYNRTGGKAKETDIANYLCGNPERATATASNFLTIGRDAYERNAAVWHAELIREVLYAS